MNIFCDRCGYTWSTDLGDESASPSPCCARCLDLGHYRDWLPLSQLLDRLGVGPAFQTLPPEVAVPFMQDADDQLRRAEVLARAVHTKPDKAGRNYYEAHLLDVLARAQAYGADPDEQAAALLHDVVEDTAVTEEDLLSCGFSDKTLLCVHLMTDRKDGPKEVYYARLRAYEPARRLKLDADVASNTDPARQALLDPAAQEKFRTKYTKARQLLAGRPTREG